MVEDGPGWGHLCHTDTFLVLIILSFIGLELSHCDNIPSSSDVLFTFYVIHNTYHCCFQYKRAELLLGCGISALFKALALNLHPNA